MHVDHQTAADLDLPAAPDRSTSVFSLVDRTRTPAGRERLRELFRAPASDAGSIRATQLAVRFLHDHAEWRTIGVDARTIAIAERYLLSQYGTIARDGWLAATAESSWVQLRYPELVREAREGAGALVQLLRWLREWSSRLVSTDAPARLQRLAHDALPALETLAPWLAAGALRTPRGAMVVDRALRTEHREVVNRLRAMIGELDALMAMAIATRELGFAFPEVVAGAQPMLDLEGAWHPFLREPVRNDLRLGGAGSDRLVFLTGPNMAGKTTFMKACGIAVFLAQLGMGVPARRMRLVPVEVLVSSISTADSVRLGYSYYYAEVQRVRAVAEYLARGQRCLVLCDEPFKGTNVHDALDASRAVLTGFAACETSLFLVSSHLVELVDDLARVPGICFRCFEGEVHPDGARYDYRLRDGHSAQRLGLVLLEQAEVLALLAAGRANSVAVQRQESGVGRKA